MLPKRKLIKKPRSGPKISIEETEIESHKSLIEKLKSVNPSVKQQAITILANLHCLLSQFKEPEFIRELISVLYQSNPSLCHATIFAMVNLCELEPKLVGKLFECGLDKALVSLSSTSQELLKPILIFFITVCENLPQKYHYLPQSIRNTLTPAHIKLDAQVCLQFLVRTSNIASGKLSENIINQIVSIYRNSTRIVEKSYAVAIIVKELLPNKEVEEIFVSYMSELLVCIDLGKEYEMNFALQKKRVDQVELSTEVNKQINQVQEQEMQQQNQKKLKKQPFSCVDKQKLKYFQQTVNGIEILMQFLLDVLEQGDEDWEEQDQDQDQDQGEMQMGQKQGKSQGSHQSLNKQLSQFILKFIQQNMSIFPKFLSLSPIIVPNTQNIIYLFYHLLVHIDKQITQSISAQQQINILVQASLQNLFASVQIQRKSQQSSLSIQQYEVLVQCLEIGLGLLLKNKNANINENFLLKFSKQYMLHPTIFTSTNLLSQIKPSWLIMLQLYSQKLNPQQNIHITAEQNLILGEILKHLVITLPYTQLQQFRCQVIDTLFDAYSNQKFDSTFVKLNFFHLLQAIVKQGQNIINKQTKSKTKQKNNNKFVLDVLNDVKRFLQYKYKMIKS